MSGSNLKCKYQFKQITKTRKEMLKPIKTIFREKWTYRFKTLTSTLHTK